MVDLKFVSIHWSQFYFFIELKFIIYQNFKCQRTIQSMHWSDFTDEITKEWERKRGWITIVVVIIWKQINYHKWVNCIWFLWQNIALHHQKYEKRDKTKEPYSCRVVRFIYLVRVTFFPRINHGGILSAWPIELNVCAVWDDMIDATCSSPSNRNTDEKSK